MPARPKAAIHQMCQIIAKPATTAKNALMNPIELLFGISIGSYPRTDAGCSGFACLRSFAFQKASTSPTCGRTAKFHAGGGDAVDHSSVRPFHGSPGAR